MPAVVHVGMHKTGSSAIQTHFASAAHPGLVYAPWSGTNHCGLCVLLFAPLDSLPNYHGFKVRGPDFVARLPELRAEWLARLDACVTSLDAAARLLISAEDISATGFAEAREALFGFLAERAQDVTVIGYLRAPRAYARSAFQQRLRGPNLRELPFTALWPNYRARFEQFDRLPGVRELSLGLYDRAALRGGATW
jgi:hypothetical protein